MSLEMLGQTRAASLFGGRPQVASGRWKLSAPVGVGQPNVRRDVLIVQQMLNRFRHDDPSPTSLPETGVFDHATRHRLASFQRTVAHLRRPDAVIGLPGPTEKALRSVGLPQAKSFAGQQVPLDTSGFGTTARPVLHPEGYLTQLLALKAASPKSPIKKAFFNKLLPGAANAKVKWGTPIAVLLAQAALESHWGLTAPGNAYFGIKGTSPSGKSQMFATHEERNGHLEAETDAFRSYDTVEEATDDYGRFLRTNRRYGGAFAYANDPLKFLHAICVAKYASLGGYYPLAASIIQINGLADFDAVGAMPRPIYTDAISIGENVG